MPKVLIIEDDTFLMDLLTKKLTKEEIDVADAGDGEEGLKKMENEKPNLVLLDLMLPSMDGFEVLRRIQQNPELTKIPVVALSNLGSESDIEKAKNLGVKDYLVKANYTTDDILTKIKEYL